MNKIITKLSLIALALVCFASNANSQNLFVETPIYYGSFETNTAMWYSNATTANNGITCASSTERFVNGQRSAKFSAADCSIYTEGIAGNVSLILGGTTEATAVANINNVAAGDYTFKVKVFIADKAPSQIFIYFAESSAVITSGDVMTIPLTGVSIGSWQTIQGAITLKAYTAMKTSLRVRHQDYTGLTGASNVYFDNMELTAGAPSAVSNVNAPKFTIFAANGLATITTTEMSDISIFNITGKAERSMLGVNGKVEISTTDLNKGIYFARVSSNGISSTQKFVVR